MTAPISVVLSLVALACLSACGVSPGGARGSVSEELVAIVDVTVIPMDSERVLPGQTVLVRDGVIAGVGPVAAMTIPADAQRIDGSSSYVVPGLIDAHVHLRDRSELLAYLAHGVTTVVQLGGPSGNVSSVIDLRERVARGEVPGPTIYASGRMLDGESPTFPGVSSSVRTSEDARRIVAEQLGAGADFIKVYNGLRTELLEAVTQAADEHGVAVWGHIPRIDGRATALQRALTAGLDVIAHGEEVFFTMLYGGVESQLDRGMIPTVDEDLVRSAVRLIHQHGAVVIPNLSFVAMTRAQLDDVQRVWDDPESRYLPPTVRSMWAQQNPTRRADLRRFELRERGKQAVLRNLTLSLNSIGVPLLLGTDASAPGMFPGKSAHVELAELVLAGLTPFQALATGTRNAGSVLHRQVPGGPPFGTVTEGSRADLLLLHANPLADISNTTSIRGVVARGKWYPREYLDSMRVAASAAAAR